MPTLPQSLAAICEISAFSLIVAIRESPAGFVDLVTAEQRFDSKAVRHLLDLQVCVLASGNLTLDDAVLRSIIYGTLGFNLMVVEGKA